MANSKSQALADKQRRSKGLSFNARLVLLLLAVLAGTRVWINPILDQHREHGDHAAQQAEDDTGGSAQFGRQLDSVSNGPESSSPKVAPPAETRETTEHVVTSVVEDPAYSPMWNYEDRYFRKTAFVLDNLCFSLQTKTFDIFQGDREAIGKFAARIRPKGATTVGGTTRQTPIPQADVVRRISGVTAVTTEMSITGSQGAHFYFWSEPLFSVVAFLRQALKLDPKTLHVAYSSLDLKSLPSVEQEVWKMFFHQIPEDNFLGLVNSSRAEGTRKYVCMDRAVVLNGAFASVVRDKADTSLLRSNIKEATGLPLANHCKDKKLNHSLVHVLSRQVFSRKFSNEAALVEVIKSVFGASTEVVLFDSPNQRCKTRRPGTFCDYLPDRLDSSQLKDPMFFNQATFLISVHGAGNMNYIYLPEGAHTVEIMPVGVRYDMYGDLANRIGLNYFSFDEPNRTLYDSNGLGSVKPAFCEHDNDCRRISKELPVHVTLEGDQGLRPLLERAHGSWRQRCSTE